MCGISGIYDLAGFSEISRADLFKMNNAISHRGPDGEGFYSAPGVALGHRRLSIIDVAGGQQPIFNETRTVVVVFNGEIYNYQELATELASLGHRFRTHSDSETIAHAWEEWGEKCVERFRGMFAFALYDSEQQMLFLARDRLGKKPLYYSIVAGRYLIFASELKGIMAHPLFDRELDLTAVDNYFAFGYVPDPATIYKNAFKLPPAHVLRLKKGSVAPRADSYWRPSFAVRNISESDASRELIERLDQSVRLRLMSEVPLGAFLSGGVDSSGVVASMSRQINSPVETFALGFGAESETELGFAQRIATLYGTHHHSQDVDAEPLAEYRRQAAIFDEPFADDSSLPTYQVCKFARKNVTVALSGDGGDEVFAGYRRYRLHGVVDRWRNRVPAHIRRPLFQLAADSYPKLDWAPRWLRAKYTMQEMALDAAGGYFRSVCKIHDDLRAQLYSDKMRRQLEHHHPADLIADAMRDSDASDAISRAQSADLKTYLPGDILTKVDRTSMAVSLEVRAPFLDHQFVEWAASLPQDLKIKDGEGKYILKRALEPYVPKKNLYRTKIGFATPMSPFFREDGAKFARRALMSAEISDSGLFNLETISRLIDEHETARRDHSKALWSLLMFDGFLKEVHHRSRETSIARNELASV